MKDFKQLLVWQKAHALTLEVYRVTGHFPGDEKFVLTSQLRRSAASAPANLVEGGGRRSRNEYAHFVGIACGSALETEYHLLLAKDLGYLALADHERLESQLQEIKRMLYGLSHSLKSPLTSAP